MKIKSHIFILLIIVFFSACTGNRKYFKAAEKLEKKGLVDEAASYYLEALERKPTSVKTRIKLKEVGQKYVTNLASEFFRNFNTEQYESALETYEKLQKFNDRSKILDLSFDYPKTYEEDYHKSIEMYCLKNYNQALLLVSQKRYSEALTYTTRVLKYNTGYKSIVRIDEIAYCEPLYQNAINNLENKNYSAALGYLSSINGKTSKYKDSPDLLELASAKQTKSFILFEPKQSRSRAENEIKEELFSSFNETASQKLTGVKIINNTPFQNAPSNLDLNNVNNQELFQAIRKATGADYFYIFDVENRRESTPPSTSSNAKAYEEIKYKKDDVVITDYKERTYTTVKASRVFSYELKYKLINAYSNQIVASEVKTITQKDEIVYQKCSSYNGNVDNLYPFDPRTTTGIARLGANSWRKAFSARTSLKTYDDLKSEANDISVKTFVNSASRMR